MLGSLPATIDPIRLADTGMRLAGTLAVRVMQRLAAVSQNDGEVLVDLLFERETGSGLRLMHGTLSAKVVVACQRCLEPMTLTLTAQPKVFMLKAGESGRQPSDEVDFIIVDKSVSLSKLVEDELILAVPMYPVHDMDACLAGKNMTSAASEELQEKDNPFSVLRSLKPTGK